MPPATTALERWERLARAAYQLCRVIDAELGRLPSPAERGALAWIVYSFEDKPVQDELAAADREVIDRAADLLTELLAYLDPEAEERITAAATDSLYVDWPSLRKASDTRPVPPEGPP